MNKKAILNSVLRSQIHTPTNQINKRLLDKSRRYKINHRDKALLEKKNTLRSSSRSRKKESTIRSNSINSPRNQESNRSTHKSFSSMYKNAMEHKKSVQKLNSQRNLNKEKSPVASIHNRSHMSPVIRSSASNGTNIVSQDKLSIHPEELSIKEQSLSPFGQRYSQNILSESYTLKKEIGSKQIKLNSDINTKEKTEQISTILKKKKRKKNKNKNSASNTPSHKRRSQKKRSTKILMKKLRERSKKKKKKKLLSSKKQRKITLIELLFFTNFSRLFNKGYRQELKESDLFPLNEGVKVDKTVELFDISQTLHGTSLGMTLIRISRKNIIYATILLIIYQSMSVGLPFIMASFVKAIKNQDSNQDIWDHQKLLKLSGHIGSVVFIIWMQGLVREHALKYVCKVTSRTGQCLRGIFFSHIMTANYTFLRNVDASFIAKMSIYEFDAIVRFIANIPNMASFPLPFILSVVLIVLQVGTVSLITVPLFLAAGIFHGFMDHRMLAKNVLYKKVGSIRTRILIEVMTDVSYVKANSYEPFYMKKLEDLRKMEIKTLNSMSFERALGNSILFLMPLASATLIIFLKHYINEEKVDVVVSLAIVSVLNLLRKPLRMISSLVDLYLDFEIGHKSLDRFFTLVRQKPVKEVNYPYLNVGEIKMFNCTGSVDRELQTHQLIDLIFDRNQEKNRKNAKSKMKKAQKKLKMMVLLNKSKTQKKNILGKIQKSNRNKAQNHPSGIIQNKGVSPPPQIDGNDDQAKALNHISGLFSQDHQRVDKNGCLMLHMDTTLNISPGQVVCLMGESNSGASGVLLSIMEETYIIQGVSESLGSFAYLDIKSNFFLNKKTLRENIILDQTYKKSRYDTVLRICQLDLSKFMGSDMMEVIEFGRNFSINERKKVILARFLYSERDIYLFEDYFDAFSPEIGAAHFNIIVRQFLKDKTIVFLARNQEVVERSDYVYILHQGTVVDQGTPKELKMSKIQYYSKFLIKNKGGGTIESKTKSDRILKKWSNIVKANELSSEAKNGLFQLSKLMNNKKEENSGQVLQKLIGAIAEVNLRKFNGRMTTEVQEDRIKGLIYLLKKYLFVKGKCRMMALFCIFLVCVMSLMTTDIWLGLWSSKFFVEFQFEHYLLTYASLSLFSAMTVFGRDLVFHIMIRHNSDLLHHQMLVKFFNTAMEWFVHNPSSRVTYRLTRDQLAIDDQLNKKLQEAFDSFMLVICGVIILNLVFFGPFLIVTLLTSLYVWYVLARFFSVTSVLTQYEAKRKAELQAMYLRAMTDSINFRQLCMLSDLRDQFFAASNDFQTMSTHLGFFSQRWLGMKVMWLKACVVAVIFVMALVLKVTLPQYYFTKPWQLALGLTWSLKVVDHLDDFIRQFTQSVHLIISVGRIFNYINHDKEEMAPVSKKGSGKGESDEKFNISQLLPDSSSRQKGSCLIFEVQQLNMSYGKQSILKDINLKVKNLGRIAIFGNPGSGKHSLMKALMRIFYPQSGKMLFYGEDVNNLHPKEIRELGIFLSVNPPLIGSTIQDYIDPNSEFSTTDLCKMVHFLGFFEILKSNLEDLKEVEDMAQIEKNPEKRMQLVMNIANLYSQNLDGPGLSPRKSGLRKFEGSDAQSNKLISKVFNGLVSNMLIKSQENGEPDFEDQNMVASISPKQRRRSSIHKREAQNGTPQLANKEYPNPSIGSGFHVGSLQKCGNSIEGDQDPPQLTRKYSDFEFYEALRKKKLGNFELKSQTGQLVENIETLENFLNRKILNHGQSLPNNIVRLISLAKTLVKFPSFLFFDESVLDMGGQSHWDILYKKMDRILSKSTIFGILNSVKHLKNFDYLVFMDNGRIVEQGDMTTILKDRNSKIFKLLQERNYQGSFIEQVAEVDEDSDGLPSAPIQDDQGHIDFGHSFEFEQLSDVSEHKEDVKVASNVYQSVEMLRLSQLNFNALEAAESLHQWSKEGNLKFRGKRGESDLEQSRNDDSRDKDIENLTMRRHSTKHHSSIVHYNTPNFFEGLKDQSVDSIKGEKSVLGKRRGDNSSFKQSKMNILGMEDNKRGRGLGRENSSDGRLHSKIELEELPQVLRRGDTNGMWNAESQLGDDQNDLSQNPDNSIIITDEDQMQGRIKEES